ncbi:MULTISPECIES: alkaline shock response membrane anchor protein AmaP [unclassified Arthrobacter]|uniref:alkaline shock response membrane anchor protein AmaP n=1 Tax=unclassified Arthrobacter TaxID=235627 RepID=UPI001D13DF07|nr:MULTISPECIES: alkaline shock response membrane anchor protein AmaP [unclassified Arthrobacter]MCC3289722.1 alkaline shock response membrane anchor protein AmaP [Arthrobacter sp. zg-Y1110]MCC3300762.1 alkaline shock response membrane anchor protein AmaP [Arthrobacter sp. zg-Y895]UWX84858.1 alkaline shock response membrane anchor protein AmaP [Arthrobacter sp. zg-Y1110]
MRHHSGRANRTWLIILGVLFLAAGVLAALIASGTLDRLIGGSPGRSDRVLSESDGQGFLAGEYVPWGMLLAGVILGILGLWWLLAQIPRSRPAGTFRLQEDPAHGVTVCDPQVLASAVSNETEQLPGVVGSTVRLRGTADEPDLAMKVTVNSDADVQGVIARIQQEVVPHLVSALEVPLNTFGLEIDASSKAGAPGGGATVSSRGTVVY